MLIPIVSIIIACRNEEKHIMKCLYSLIQQNYPKENFEIIITDGMSTDSTKKIIENFRISNLYHQIIILNNPKKFNSFGFNLGIKKAKGKTIIILGSHSFIDKNFIAKNVEYLQKIDADCAGGPIETIGESFIGKVISLVLSSPFGVGGAKFRYSQKEGYVDTVAYGAYKREVFDKIGLFDERLIRNHDIEFNTRLTKNGGKIFMTPKIKSYYHCPDSLIRFVGQGFSNGLWNIYTQKLVPGSLKLRHFVPLFFVVGLLGSYLISLINSIEIYILYLIIFLYIIASLFFSFKTAKKNGFKYFPLLPFFFFILHVSYGFGSLWGILTYYKIKK
jgi:glycosyltransferase involved in cell wall biosynthesis